MPPAGTSQDGLSIILEDAAAIADSLGDRVRKLQGKTVLITGANGFLPSYLADAIAYFNTQYFSDHPARLLLLVRNDVQPATRLGHLLGRSDVRFIVQDVCHTISIGEPIHFIIHAASPASPRWYLADPVGTIDANSVALRQLLELALQSEVESFLYFSSSEVYGSPEPESIPTPETYVGRVDFTSPRSCYVESKRFGETLCYAFFRQHQLPVKVVRPFHIHGPGLRIDDGRIVAELISQGLRGQAFELLSAGRATRTYGYVSDATDGFLRVLLSEHNGEAFNVGADSPETSVVDLATIVSGLFDIRYPVRVATAPNDEGAKGSPDRVCPDLSKIRSLLGYSHRVPLEQGLARTIRWHRSFRMA